MKIYIVIYRYYEYEDSFFLPKKAFKNKEQADSFAKKCQSIIDEIKEKCYEVFNLNEINFYERDGYEINRMIKSFDYREYDKELDLTCWNWDNHDYEVYEMELE